MAAYLDRLTATLLHDASPKDLLPFYYKIMNYQEGPYDELHTSGLSTDYVAREIRRAKAGVGDQVKIYPGIDIDVPTRAADKRTKPDDVRRSDPRRIRRPCGWRRTGARIRRDVAGEPHRGGGSAPADFRVSSTTSACDPVMVSMTAATSPQSSSGSPWT